jgi:endonuclease/exonuclease/phosphatase (EEP) superfamily protein YafD
VPKLHATLLFLLLALTVGITPRELPASHGTPVQAADIAIVSVNMAKFTNVDRVIQEFKTNPAIANADVFLLQEVVQVRAGTPSSSDQLAERLGLKTLFATPEPEGTTSGVAILSRYPLEDAKIYSLKAHNLHIRSRSRVALAATLRTAKGPVRIITTHLDTRINIPDRLEQLGPVIEDAKAFPGPRIIGGDLNTNNMRWLASLIPIPFAQVQTTAVQRLMQSHGFETAFAKSGPTFDFFGFRLDWIFHQGISPLASGIQPLKFSDHHAIWAQYRIASNRELAGKRTAAVLNNK